MKASVFGVIFDDNEEEKAVGATQDGTDIFAMLGSQFPTLEQMKEEQKKEYEDGSLPKLPFKEGTLVLSTMGKVYVPMNLRNMVMEFYHYSRYGQHAGVNRMYRAIVKRFWWPYLKEALQEYVSGCLTCLRMRVPTRSIGTGVHLASEPMIMVAMDFVEIGYVGVRKKLLTMIDYATRFPVVVESLSQTATQAWRDIYMNWVVLFGCPLYILTDNGPPFQSEEFKRKLAACRITSLNSTAYYPQGNAVIESFHQFLRRGLTILSRINAARPFTEALATVLYHYRATPTAATGDSPFRLLTGVDMLQPGLQEYTTIIDLPRNQQLECLINLRSNLMDRLVRKSAEENRKVGSLPALKVGDIVVYELNVAELQAFNRRFVQGKAIPKWSEPMRILSIDPTGQRLVIRSIWMQGKRKEVSVKQVLRVNKPKDAAGDRWLGVELLNERRENLGQWPLPSGALKYSAKVFEDQTGNTGIQQTTINPGPEARDVPEDSTNTGLSKSLPRQGSGNQGRKPGKKRARVGTVSVEDAFDSTLWGDM